MKIQLTKNKTIEWAAPWEKTSTEVLDVVGIELGSGNEKGCPAVRLQRRKGVLSVSAVGFVAEPNGKLPTSWDELRHQPKWSVPTAFRAECAALTVNSPDATTRQLSRESISAAEAANSESVAASKDGVRSVFCKMSDDASVLQATLPEYQVLWYNRLLPEGHHPTAVSVQTTASSLLCSLAAQPGFCEEGDDAAIFVTNSYICVAGFRKGIPLLFRECTGVAGAAAMREAVRAKLGLDDAMLDAVFGVNGIIDTSPALEPLLAPALEQIEFSIDYLQSRLGSNPKRLFLMGNATGCSALQRIVGERLSLPLVTPNPFDGLELPAKSVSWKERYCVGEKPPVFLAAIGAALAVLEEKK